MTTMTTSTSTKGFDKEWLRLPSKKASENTALPTTAKLEGAAKGCCPEILSDQLTVVCKFWTHARASKSVNLWTCNWKNFYNSTLMPFLEVDFACMHKLTL